MEKDVMQKVLLGGTLLVAGIALTCAWVFGWGLGPNKINEQREERGESEEILNENEQENEEDPIKEEDESAYYDDGPILFGTMTHMEGDFTDDTNERIFLKHVNDLRFAMDLADEYGALLTIESEKPFARANTIWGLNFMQEILDRGHGVGTHCDVGFKITANTTIEDFVEMLRENKSLVDGLVGEENNRGCSGAGSSLDWVLAASQAGFSYINGVVGMHYLAMDISARPEASWTDAYIRSEGFHENAPVNLADRMRLMGLSDAKDFEPDEDWNIALLAGSLGKVENMAEEKAGTACPERACPFTKEDTEALVGYIREADRLRDTSYKAKLDVYFPANAFTAANEEPLRAFFAAMQELEEEGLIVWATQGQMYDAFLGWNQEK